MQPQTWKEEKSFQLKQFRIYTIKASGQFKTSFMQLVS